MQIPKLLLHRLFPNVRFSVWIDAKLQLVVDRSNWRVIVMKEMSCLLLPVHRDNYHLVVDMLTVGNIYSSLHVNISNPAITLSFVFLC